MWTRRAVLLSIPHAALCVSGRDKLGIIPKSTLSFQCRTQHCVCRDGTYSEAVDAFAAFQCRMRHYVCRDYRYAKEHYSGILFQCRTWHYVCRDCRVERPYHGNIWVSMPHAALCVSGSPSSAVLISAKGSFNTAHGIMCVEISSMIAHALFFFNVRTKNLRQSEGLFYQRFLCIVKRKIFSYIM